MNSSSKRFIFLSILISILLAPLIFSGGGLDINIPDVAPIPEVAVTPKQIIDANIALIQTSITEINTAITRINTALTTATTAQATTFQKTQINNALTTAQTARTTAETALQQAQQLTSDTQRAIELQTIAQTAVETANAQVVIAQQVVEDAIMDAKVQAGTDAAIAEHEAEQIAASITVIRNLITEINTAITQINTALTTATTAQATTAQITQINTAKTTAQTAKTTAQTALQQVQQLTDTQRAIELSNAQTATTTAKAQAVIAQQVAADAVTAHATALAATQAAIEASTPATTSTLTVTTNQPTECAAGSICKKIGRKGGSIDGLYSGSTCYRIINTDNNNDYFVPLNSVTEFNSFVNNKPSGVTVTDCQGITISGGNEFDNGGGNELDNGGVKLVSRTYDSSNDQVIEIYSDGTEYIVPFRSEDVSKSGEPLNYLYQNGGMQHNEIVLGGTVYYLFPDGIPLVMQDVVNEDTTTDTDGDGIPNYVDPDDNNNGIRDTSPNGVLVDPFYSFYSTESYEKGHESSSGSSDSSSGSSGYIDWSVYSDPATSEITTTYSHGNIE